MPILFERPTYEWVARVNQKHKQLDDLQLSERAMQQLNRLIEIEFVYSTLKLGGLGVERDQVALLAASQASSNDAEAKAASDIFESLRFLTSLAREKGKDAVLSVDLLFQLNDMPVAQALPDGDASAETPAGNARAVLESACQWFTADSFSELHPVEQASIVFLRLIELLPFDKRNERTALIAASLFTLRSGLPPIIIKPETQPAYRAALNEGVRMNTKPMVEFLAETIERTLDLSLAASK